MVSKSDQNPNFATRTHYYFKGFINIKIELLWINEEHFSTHFPPLFWRNSKWYWNHMTIHPVVLKRKKGEMHFLFLCKQISIFYTRQCTSKINWGSFFRKIQNQFKKNSVKYKVDFFSNTKNSRFISSSFSMHRIEI